MVLVLLFFFFVVFSYSSRLICDKTIIKLVVRVSETSRKVCKVQTHKSSEVQTLKILSNPPTIHSPDEFSTHHLMILNGHIQPRVPEVIQGRGANCAKGASRAAGELRERDILLCSFSLFVCVKNGYPPSVSL